MTTASWQFQTQYKRMHHSHLTYTLEQREKMTSTVESEQIYGTDLSRNSMSGFFKDALDALSNWYHESVASLNDNVNSVNSNTGSTQPSILRLHERAELYRSSLAAGTASVIFKKEGTDSSTAPQLTSMPIGVVLHILSFLDARSLCRLSQTCHQLHSAAGDQLLWKRKLQSDSKGWAVLGHLSHPRVYQDASSDLTEQQIYANCFTNRMSLPAHSFTHPVTHKLKLLVRKLQRNVPRLLMFGSGLESVPIVKMMLWEELSPYRPTGMFPGKDGVGSGVCISHRNNSINLVTLYTATKAERQAASLGNRARVNKLVSPFSHGAGDDQATELTAAVQEQCQLANGFILAVDAGKLGQEEVAQDISMLKAMLLSSSNQSPLLVLACQMNEESSNGVLSPLEVADKLSLCSFNHPWQICKVVLQSFEGLQNAMDWLLEASQ